MDLKIRSYVEQPTHWKINDFIFIKLGKTNKQEYGGNVDISAFLLDLPAFF